MIDRLSILYLSITLSRPSPEARKIYFVARIALFCEFGHERFFHHHYQTCDQSQVSEGLSKMKSRGNTEEIPIDKMASVDEVYEGKIMLVLQRSALKLVIIADISVRTNPKIDLKS